MPTAFPPPPRSEAELIERAHRLAGRTLGWIAARHVVRVPPDLRRAKGWPGQLLEIALGATASSRPVPDFPHLGVEMKSIPVDLRGKPLEGTYVCTAPLSVDQLGSSWEESWVRHKLARVLWVPLLPAESVADRVVGTPILWSPSPEEEAALREDWEDFVQLVALGELWQVHGRRGKVLQLRPKAADRHSTTWALDEGGEWVQALPRGFYLRPGFTRAILARELLLPE